MAKKTKKRLVGYYYDGENSYNLYEDEINIELAENGADREMDFDPELEFEIRYEDYLNQNKIKNT